MGHRNSCRAMMPVRAVARCCCCHRCCQRTDKVIRPGWLPGSGNNYWGDSGGFRGDAILRLYTARKMRPMTTATTAITIPPMIAASAEAPVAKAMTREITPATNPGITAPVIDVLIRTAVPLPQPAAGADWMLLPDRSFIEGTDARARAAS